MKLNIKILREIIGFLITVTSISLLFLNENYVAGAVLVFIFILFSLFLFFVSIRKPLNYKSVYYDLDLVDNTGGNAILEKKSRIKILEDNITQITDNDFSSCGQIQFLETNIGELSTPINEGGTYTMITFLRRPLKNGDEINHIVKAKYINSFIEDRENFTINVGTIKESLELTINFPSDRPCLNAESYLVKEGRAIDIPKPRITNNNRSIKLKIIKPKAGAKYVLAWTW